MGAKEEYGVVVGDPSENPHLKYGVNYPEFSDTMRDRMASEFPYGQYLLCLFNDLKSPLELSDVKEMPKKDTSIQDEDERKLLWKLKMNEWNKRKVSLVETMKKVYLGWDQCTKTMQNLINADASYESKRNEHDPVYLLSTIRELVTGVDKKRNLIRIYYKKPRESFLMRMDRGETLNLFRTRVKSQISLIKSISGGGIFQPDFSDDPGLISTCDSDLEEKFVSACFSYISSRPRNFWR